MFSVLLPGPTDRRGTDTWTMSRPSPDQSTWNQLKIGMCAADVEALLGPAEVAAPTAAGGVMWSYLHHSGHRSWSLTAFRQGLFDEEPSHTLLTIRMLNGQVTEILTTPTPGDSTP